MSLEFRNRILCGDALKILRRLPDNSVHCAVTSPPYFRLRDYGYAGQIGLEETVDEYIAKLVEVFREVRRVLRHDGTLWLNLGDSYANDAKWGGSGGGKRAKGLHGTDKTRDRARSGFQHKQLLMIPHRVAIALQANGWYVRSDIVWAKPSPMPESVQDRPTRAHEYIFLLAKSRYYFYDIDAIREPVAESTKKRYRYGWNGKAHAQHPGTGRTNNTGKWIGDPVAKEQSVERGKNKTTVWVVPPANYKKAHFATFPPDLIAPPILAGCPERVCSACGTPYRRIVTREFVPQADVSPERVAYRGKIVERKYAGRPRGSLKVRTEGFQPGCDCGAVVTSGVVLDPFIGSGTTAVVAKRARRDFIGIEANPEYVAMAYQRLGIPGPGEAAAIAELPLFQIAEQTT